MTPNGKTHRLLTRLAVDKLLHPFQPFIIGQKCLAPKMAIRFNIPLVFYGEQEAEYGTPINEAMSSKRDWTFSSITERDEMFFGGVSYSSLKNNFNLSDNDLSVYVPEDINIITDKAIDFRYLGYYLKWHPQSNYYYSIQNTNFEVNPDGRTEGTYTKYASLDDKIDGLHFYTWFIKTGRGRATDDAAIEVRNKIITREEAVALVKKYDGEFPKKYFKDILNYLKISKNSFFKYCDKFRSPHIWKKINKKWHLRHTANFDGVDD